MQPESWRRRLGNDIWHYVCDQFKVEDVAEVLTKLYEVGWRGPEVEPKIDPQGLKVFWPASGSHGVGALTSEGLAKFYRDRGHRYFLLRSEQACRAMGGPLAPRFQEFLVAYETQCRAEGLDPLPDFADWEVFVGGEGTTIDADNLVRLLSSE